MIAFQHQRGGAKNPLGHRATACACCKTLFELGHNISPKLSVGSSMLPLKANGTKTYENLIQPDHELLCEVNLNRNERMHLQKSLGEISLEWVG